MRDDEYEIVIARHGTREGKRSEAYLNFDWYGEPDSAIVTDYYVWVLRNAQRTIFVDTGYSASAARARGRTVLHPVADLYRTIGVDPAGGSPVILTHGHWDHIGNLGLFPRSTFTVCRAEMQWWRSRPSRAAVPSHFVESAEIAELLALNEAGRTETFEQRLQIAPGITALRVGGHTPGQAMVFVQTAAGRVVLTSDAVHFAEELDLERPFTAAIELAPMYEAFYLIKGMLTDGRVDLIVPGHDPGALALGRPIAEDVSIIDGR